MAKAILAVGSNAIPQKFNFEKPNWDIILEKWKLKVSSLQVCMTY